VERTEAIRLFVPWFAGCPGAEPPERPDDTGHTDTKR
jgi:hypothetical protein